MASPNPSNDSTPNDDPKPFLIIKTGQAVPEARALGGDFEDWFIAGLGRQRFSYRTVRVDRDEPLPSPQGLAGVLITGSPAMVSHRADWSERTAEWLAGAQRAGLPMLGVCYGHQLLAHALGGAVGPNPRGRRMGRVEIHSIEADDPLMGRFAPTEFFHVSHTEAVLEPPPGARVVAEADHDPYHALHFGRHSWGVQFHPEFGRAVMRAYLQARAEALTAEGQDPVALVRGVADDTVGPAVLARFGALVERAQRPAAA
ncbi:glutamine amidotransferase [Wenzhouxiangella sp. XN79A]|uniref:glutamine amidotransferase n=1 Tax=Wenzhouxiangella sp. XN79A TaxID=2724193 RepID=UPI00144AD017|nr:glutamine amidotransferase [Wenzhouxiangella sp. XN79A]